MDSAVAFPPVRQHLSTVAQLAEAEVSRGQLARAIEEGAVQRIRRGVYSNRPLPGRGTYLLTNGLLDLGYLAEVRAVMLEVSEHALAGGRTAALLWGFDLAVEPEGIEIVVPPGGAWKRDGVDVTQLKARSAVPLRARALDPIPTLSAVATVLHCALVLPIREAVTVADSAMRNRTLSRADLAAGVRQHRGKRGYRRMRRVLDWSDDRSGSVLESLFRVLVLEAGLLRPTSQVWLPRAGRVDFCWKRHRLVVECDGRRWHDPADARNNDRRRDNGLELTSWRLLRFTWDDVVNRPEQVVADVRLALEGWMARAA
jgi:very-short-patch-repair endonuclease